MKNLLFGGAYLMLIMCGSALGTMLVQNKVTTQYWQPIVGALLSLGIIVFAMMP